jgi:hypothetical protein
MASKKPVDERVRAFVASVLAERPEREEHINDIELDMEELADAVADEFAAQVLARQAKAKASANCPHCGREGRPLGERQREILTTRGSAPLVEPKHYCPACRRHFFPSVDRAGPGA